MERAEISQLRVALDREVAYFRAAPGTKLARRPLRLTRSKLLVAAARATNRTWRRWARTFWGGNMLVVLPEPVSVSIHRYGFHDEGLTRAFLALIRPGATVFDVGCHFGYFSLLAAHLAGAEGVVHAFEPTPSTYEIAARNAATVKNVAVHNVAAAGRTGKAIFNDYGIRWSAFNSLHAPRLDDAAAARLVPRRHEVATTTLDAHVRATGARPALVKIDAEGAELEIVSGMVETIATCKPVVCVEVGDFGDAAAGPSRELLGWLIDRGYDPFETTSGALVPHTLRERYDYGNVVLLPR